MINDFLGTAIRAAESSGKILIQYFDKLHDSSQKNENIRDLVTEVDFLSENNIKEIITSQFPRHNIIAEETGGLDINSEYCWHVDPIDGTVNYSQGIPLCAISIGLEFDGEIIAGAVHNPFSRELFYASKGNGAFLNGKQISVSNKSEIEDGLYVVGFSSEIGESKHNEYQSFGNINDSTRGVLRLGSAAVALAYLACGRIDGFWAKGLFSWDIAAGAIIVKEAGGYISDIKWQQRNYIDNIIASNTILHSSLVNIL
jgi:myo-inositol-1(or 4)-monophosphatase